jgi:FixJ family two-component response regulator
MAHPALPRIAVVDDDAPVRRALQRLLTAAGFDVQTFGSAEDLLDVLEGPEPNDLACLILDVHLPKMNGLSLREHLTRSGRGIGVVFITADHELAGGAEIRSTGWPCLGKPLDETALLEAIDEVIGRRQG